MLIVYIFKGTYKFEATKSNIEGKLNLVYATNNGRMQIIDSELKEVILNNIDNLSDHLTEFNCSKHNEEFLEQFSLLDYRIKEIYENYIVNKTKLNCKFYIGMIPIIRLEALINKKISLI